MPNGMTIQSSHTCNLLITDLPPQARQAHMTSAELTNFGGSIMRQRMQRHLHSKPGHGFQQRKMCNVRIPRSKITLVVSRLEKEI
jgi:hypothetical protein